MVDLNGHEAGNGGHSQGKPTAYRDSSTRRDVEKLTSQKSAEIRSRQDALQTTFSDRLDVFYPPNFP